MLTYRFKCFIGSAKNKSDTHPPQTNTPLTWLARFLNFGPARVTCHHVIGRQPAVGVSRARGRQRRRFEPMGCCTSKATPDGTFEPSPFSSSLAVKAKTNFKAVSFDSLHTAGAKACAILTASSSALLFPRLCRFACLSLSVCLMIAWQANGPRDHSHYC